jgi:hypothetical protein
MKENVNQNLPQAQSHGKGSVLNSKLFKFKKGSGVVRHFGDNISSHPFTSLINLEPE